MRKSTKGVIIEVARPAFINGKHACPTHKLELQRIDGNYPDIKNPVYTYVIYKCPVCNYKYET